MSPTVTRGLVFLLTIAIGLGIVAPQLAAVRVDRASDSCYARALRWLDTGRPERAVDELRTMIRFQPNVAEYHLMLGRAYQAVYDSARGEYGREGQESFWEIAEEYLIARSLRSDDFDIAREYATHLLRAEEFGMTPNWEEALSAWQYCLVIAEEQYERDPSYWYFSSLKASVLFQLGRIELKRNRHDSARGYLTEVLNIMPESHAARVLLSRTNHDR